MPRDGSGTYTLPFPPVITNTTISSAVENGTDADIAQDLNTPRPIVAGGTGGSSATQALFNLSGEKATQNVTNWDSQVWLPGSFYAATSASGTAPVAAHAFAGICYLNEALANPPTNQNLVVEATDLTDSANTKYIRVMTAGVWSTWTRVGVTSPAGTLGEYTFDTGTSFPPASGTVRFNNATQNSTTELFISHLTATGVDVTSSIPLLKAGNDIAIQDKTKSTSYKIFTTTAGPVMSGGDCRILVTAKIAGSDIANAVRVLVSVPGGPAVRYDAAQNLAEPQQTQGRQNIYAAPFDAASYNGLQVNGSMEVSQENGNSTISVIGNTSKYVVDGWIIGTVGLQTVSAGQSTVTPSGCSQSVQIYASVANASPGPSDRTTYIQCIEGYRTLRLAWGTSIAQPITISFWVYCTNAGLFSGSVRNGAENRSYTFSYTISTPLTWEYKTLTIPGDTTGTWTKDQTLGMELTFAILAGSSFLTTAGAWVAGNYLGVPGTSNILDNTSKYIMFTNITIFPGNEAPSAARPPLIMRPYDNELRLCRRFYYKRTANLVGYAVAAGDTGQWFAHPVTMRAAPTITSSGGTPSNSNGIVTSSYITIDGFVAYTKGSTTGLVYLDGFTQVVDARL